MRRKVQVWIRHDSQVLIFKTSDARGGFWQPVTGGVEDGEELRAAAVREVHEETGFAISPDALVELPPPFVFKNRWGEFEEFSWVVTLPSRVIPTLDPQEHHAAEWLPISEALSRLKFESNADKLRQLAAIEG